MKRIAIAGSTGSIGRQTLDIVSERPDLYQVAVLAAGSNVDLLVEQCRRFKPALAIIAEETKYRYLHDTLTPLGIETASGATALADAMSRQDFDTVVTATVGYSGMEPTLRAIEAGKEIALANKETLVVAGELVNRRLQNSRSRILPVDSEHSAIYQCLVGENPSSVYKLIITASGGPFRMMSEAQLRHVTVEQALAHPNWHMGAKITIDSATMLNKAFEIIEARWLFNIPIERIRPLVHPQSIVHSMVEFIDGSVKAQLGVPDMHLPISYALGEAHRLPSTRAGLDLEDIFTLTFEEPDLARFPCLGLAGETLRRGGTAACAVNAANEVANRAFRNGKIAFTDIYPIIAETMERAPFVAQPEYEDYVNVNKEAAIIAEELTQRRS